MSDQIYMSDYVEWFQSCTGLLAEYEGQRKSCQHIRWQKSIVIFTN